MSFILIELILIDITRINGDYYNDATVHGPEFADSSPDEITGFFIWP
jgi:hypothetical protein